MTQKSLTFDECKQMSSRIIAMNPNRRANMGQISSHLLDYYTELTKQPWLAQLVGQIRDLTAQQNQMMQQEEMKAGETYQQLDRKISDLKKQLPFRSPHYFHFLEDHRAQKFIDPEAFTFQTTVDIDNPEEVEPAVKNALLLNGMFDEPTEEALQRKNLLSRRHRTLERKGAPHRALSTQQGPHRHPHPGRNDHSRGSECLLQTHPRHRRP